MIQRDRRYGIWINIYRSVGVTTSAFRFTLTLLLTLWIFTPESDGIKIIIIITPPLHLSARRCPSAHGTRHGFTRTVPDSLKSMKDPKLYRFEHTGLSRLVRHVEKVSRTPAEF